MLHLHKHLVPEHSLQFTELLCMIAHPATTTVFHLTEQTQSQSGDAVYFSATYH